MFFHPKSHSLFVSVDVNLLALPRGPTNPPWLSQSVPDVTVTPSNHSKLGWVWEELNPNKLHSAAMIYWL